MAQSVAIGFLREPPASASTWTMHRHSTGSARSRHLQTHRLFSSSLQFNSRYHEAKAVSLSHVESKVVSLSQDGRYVLPKWCPPSQQASLFLGISGPCSGKSCFCFIQCERSSPSYESHFWEAVSQLLDDATPTHPGVAEPRKAIQTPNTREKRKENLGDGYQTPSLQDPTVGPRNHSIGLSQNHPPTGAFQEWRGLVEAVRVEAGERVRARVWGIYRAWVWGRSFVGHGSLKKQEEMRRTKGWQSETKENRG